MAQKLLKIWTAMVPGVVPLNQRDIRSATRGVSGGILIEGASPMSKKAADSHKKAAQSFKKASEHHDNAAKHHEAGNHEKAAHHAHTAKGHQTKGEQHSNDAATQHSEEHGEK